MIGCTIQIERLGVFGYQADHTLSHGQACAPHRGGIKTVGRHQDILTLCMIGKVDRADIGRHGLLNALDDNGQGLLEITSTGDFLDDATQDFEHLVAPRLWWLWWLWWLWR